MKLLTTPADLRAVANAYARVDHGDLAALCTSLEASLRAIALHKVAHPAILAAEKVAKAVALRGEV